MRQAVEQLHQAGFVRIAHRRFAIWLDPFGMLDPEVVVNLLPELGVGSGYPSSNFVRIEILPEAREDLIAGYRFYES